MVTYTKDELKTMVWAYTGRDPVEVRTQALLVVATFADSTIGVWRIETLERLVDDGSRSHPKAPSA